MMSKCSDLIKSSIMSRTFIGSSNWMKRFCFFPGKIAIAGLDKVET